MRRGIAITLAAICVACGSSSATTTDPAAGATTSPAAATTTSVSGDGSGATSAPVPSSTPEPSEDDLAVFIATVEELLAGTVYEGAAIAEPEVFVATGMLFCDWLDAGDDVDVVMARYLDELAGGVETAGDDQLMLAGALLGAAAGVLCPLHGDSVG